MVDEFADGWFVHVTVRSGLSEEDWCWYVGGDGVWQARMYTEEDGEESVSWYHATRKYLEYK